MRQFVPDAESITEFFGEYEARGYRLELVKATRLGGFALRMPLGPGHEVVPLFPLPAAEMQTEEAAQRWMEKLRDNQLNLFAHLLEQRTTDE
jgi:hypothetical protein